MGKWTDKPWERQKGESEKAFEAFAAYRDMGPERSLRAVGQQLGKSKALMERWSVAHDWQERVRAYENELDKEARAKAVKGRKDMTERHIKTVSYSHLDVYKRQEQEQAPTAHWPRHAAGNKQHRQGTRKEPWNT